MILEPACDQLQRAPLTPPFMFLPVNLILQHPPFSLPVLLCLGEAGSSQARGEYNGFFVFASCQGLV